MDNVVAAIANLKATVSDLDTRMQTGFAEVRGELSAMRGEFASIRAEMNTQFRWIMGSIGGATLTILLAVLTAILAKP